MLRDALQWLREIADQASTPVLEEIDGDIYVQKRDGELEKMGPVQPANRTHALGDIGSLALYAQRHGSEAHGAIFVGPSGAALLPDEDEARRRDKITLPLFRDDLPPDSAMDFEDLLLFLDRHEDAVEDGEALRSAIQTIRLVQKEELQYVDQGASVRLETKGSRGVEASGAEIPKWVQIRLRFGDPDHEDTLRFRLKVNLARGGGLTFELIHFSQDGSVDRWIESAMARLAEQLGSGWAVLRSAN